MSFVDQLSRLRSLRNPRRFAWVVLALSPLIAGAIWASSSVRERGAVAAVDERADDLKSAIAKAKPGDTIVLAAGTYLAPIELPAGVGVKGAGRHATIIDARAQAIGVSTEGGSNAEIADLTVMGAKQTNIKVASTKGTKIRGVRSVGGINGISFTNVENGRIENTIADENRYGIVVSGGKNVVVVNCTLARNGSIGLSLPVGERPIAFNNVVVESATCLYLGDKVVEPKIDYNLYFGQTIGKLPEQTAKNSLNEWRYLSGHDLHSVSYPVEFRDRKIGDFRPASRLSWSLERATTSDWGIAEFAGSKAPATDVDGSPRIGAIDAGAFEVSFKPSREPDGKFGIENDQGWKSAGLFDHNDRLVFYLFHELPLAKGTYSFWAPKTTDWGRPVEPGKYELRVVEAAIDWRYMGYIGDDGEAYPMSRTASVAPTAIAFDRAGHLLMAQGWSEDGTNLRAYSAPDGKLDWYFEGTSETRGLTVAGDGIVYLARNLEKTIKISRFDAKNGKPVAGGGFPKGEVEAKLDPKFEGLAELDGRLYITDRAHDEVKATEAGGSEFVGTFVVEAPSHPAADRVNHLIWMISGDKKLVAINGQGRVLVEATPVEYPAALSFYEGELAIASRKTGKVHVFDASTPTELKPKRTIGRGDGPLGPYLPDRFTFQAARGFPGSARLDVALGPNESIAVIDGNRLLVFDKDNHLIWSTYGVFGNAMTPSFADARRLYDSQGTRSILLDFEKGSWRPESFLSTGLKNEEFLGDFRINGKTYGVFLVASPGRERSLVTSRYDEHGFHPVSALSKRQNQFMIITDVNRDGRLDEHDSQKIVAGLRPGVGWFERFNVLYPNGDILAIGAGGWFARWKPSLDTRGNPVYLPEQVVSLKRDPKGIVSPYTHEYDPSSTPYCVVPAPGGGYSANVLFKTSPGGTGLSNTAGTDLVGIDSRGEVRWVHPYSEKKGIVGLARMGSVMITGVAETSEILVVDRDGLGLGGFTLPARIHYGGYFLDHTEAVRSLQGTDGRFYALAADNASGRIHWWRLELEGSVVHRRRTVTISPDAARLIARQPRRGSSTAEPAATVLRIPRLKSSFTIDGDLEKWRKEGIVPQIIVTPETSQGGISDVKDASAIIRIAYHGNSLYVQVLRFDDVVSFHQPVAFHYKQDCVEMCINGFMKGFKFDVCETTDAGPILFRQRFVSERLDKILPENHAPLAIKVLPNAQEISERKLIEDIFGEDLSDCKVIVNEFKLPIDEITYQGDPGAIFPLRPGQTFWIGFMIDDNDNPGTDVQNLMVWPSTYGTFKAVESGARAVLD